VLTASIGLQLQFERDSLDRDVLLALSSVFSEMAVPIRPVEGTTSTAAVGFAASLPFEMEAASLRIAPG